MTHFSRQRAFTLIELLVVVAIIGLLATVVIVATNQARTKARDAARAAGLKNIATALELYYANHGNYPAAHTYDAVYGGGNNWSSVYLALKTDGVIGDAKSPQSQDVFNQVLALLEPERVYASIGGGPSCTGAQDPLCPTTYYEYMSSTDSQNFRLRAKIEDLTSPLLKSSMNGYFGDTSNTTGTTACDSTLGFYCIGPSSLTFSP